MAKNTKKKSIFRHLRLVILLAILAFVATPHTRSSLDTIRQDQDKYERHIAFGFTFPFVGSYFLMKPENYDLNRAYPLVIALHGVSSHAYPAQALASDPLRKKYPAFVMVPIAPSQAFWAMPKNPAYQMQRGMPYPDHLPLVIAGARSIAAKYNIDKSKIILTGHSMGASGVIGGLELYPNEFSAGIASSGSWDPNQISHIRAPLFIYHGTQDQAIPVQTAQEIQNAARSKSLPISVTIIKGQGHGLGSIYENPEIWDRVFKALQAKE